MQFKNYFLVSLILVFFSSCGDDGLFNFNQKKLLISEYTYTEYGDFQYTYTSSDKIQKIHTGRDGDVEYYTFEYNSKGKLVYYEYTKPEYFDISGRSRKYNLFYNESNQIDSISFLYSVVSTSPYGDDPSSTFYHYLYHYQNSLLSEVLFFNEGQFVYKDSIINFDNGSKEVYRVSAESTYLRRIFEYEDDQLVLTETQKSGTNSKTNIITYKYDNKINPKSEFWASDLFYDKVYHPHNVIEISGNEIYFKYDGKYPIKKYTNKDDPDDATYYEYEDIE